MRLVLFLLCSSFLVACTPARYTGLPTQTVTSGTADYKVKVKPSPAGFDAWSCWEGHAFGFRKDLLEARREASAAAVAAVNDRCPSARVNEVISGTDESGSAHCFDVLIVCDG